MHIPDGIVPAQVCVAGYGLTGLLTWYSLRQINRQGNPSPKIPKASLLTAAFFVASSIYIPIPPTSVHLLLNGLLGVILGYFSFPAILIGLFFQSLVVGHGGLTTLGVNAAMMGIPALLSYHIFQLRLLGRRKPPQQPVDEIALSQAVLSQAALSQTTLSQAVPQGMPQAPSQSHASRCERARESAVAVKASQSRLAIGIFAFLGGSIGLALTALIFTGIVITTVPADFNVQAEQTAIVSLMVLHLPLAVLEGAFTAMLAVFLQRVKPELLAGG